MLAAIDYPEDVNLHLQRTLLHRDDIFKNFPKDETDYMSIIRATLESRGNAILRDEFKQRNTPVYPNPVSYASEHDELEAYRASYKANRKAGYSKKFLSEHESEITLYKAAKRCFDEMGLTKLPTVKSLQAEYAALMAEKKSAYSGYRKSREEIKELLTAKANVDRILEKDAEREHRESEEKAIL